VGLNGRMHGKKVVDKWDRIISLWSQCLNVIYTNEDTTHKRGFG
jgi:hypothetical protein